MIALMRVTVMLMVMLVSGCSMLSPVQTSPKKNVCLKYGSSCYKQKTNATADIVSDAAGIKCGL